LASKWLFKCRFYKSVTQIHENNLLNTSIIHGDDATTSAKKGGDNIGFNGHKKMKDDKVVGFCDRNCNVIAPFILAAASRVGRRGIIDDGGNEYADHWN